MAIVEVDPRTKRVYDRLRHMHVFRGMGDEQLLELTRSVESEMVEPGTVICEEGKTGQEAQEFVQDLEAEPPRWFYIVDRGRVKLSRTTSGRTQTLVAGDYFGMETLVAPGGPQPYTLTALDKVSLLRIKQEDFERLRKENAFFQQAIRLMIETREQLYKQPWAWLAPSENVFLILRRHSIVLLSREATPGVLLLLVSLGVGVLAWLSAPWFVTWLAFAFALGIVVWMILIWVDWGNDYYLVTNQRVVFVEKVILIYDSRNNVRMSELTAVGTATGSVADRLIDYGNVEVKTVSKPMLLAGVPYPPIIAAIIEEQIYRLRSSARENEVKLMREALRNRLSPPLAEPQSAAPPKAPSPARSPFGLQLGHFFSIQLRYEEGDTIIYRKHWWFLLLGIGGPSVALLLMMGVMGAALAGLLVPPEPVTRSALILVALVLSTVAFGWWLYEFQDWRNDLYQVTPTQIIDVYRRPLGEEKKDSAELDKIQGLESERPNLIGRLLNFGNVRITIVGKEFTFDDVYDPLSVQEDIQRRIEAHRARRREMESRQRREELVDLLSAYYLETQSAQNGSP